MPTIDSASVLTALGTACGAGLMLHLYFQRTGVETPLPTSPPSYPLIGHLLSMPKNNEHLGFIELGKKLQAKMFSLTVLGKTMIVLNSQEDAINLLQNRSGTYSDRMCPTMVVEPSLVNSSEFISLLGYNDRWRKSRRLMHPWLHKQASKSFHESQQREARLLVQRLLPIVGQLDSSEALFLEFFRTLSSTLMRSIYGYHLSGLDDPLLKEVLKLVDNLSKASMPTNFLVNVFPSLIYVPEWFPGAGWKRTAREWREQQEATVRDAFNWAKTRIESGTHEACILASLLAEGEKLGLSGRELDDYVSKIAITLFVGGADTTANTFLAFVMAMMLYPEAQRKAQEEIDNVIGTSRLPELEDQSQLPFTNRLIQEVLRWCPVVPIGVPHATTSEDLYQGFRIPKGAMVIGNIWAMSCDEKVYNNPEKFDPDRFLDPSVPPCPVFGFGRR
ncbi:unnamed protein product [Rhizoctonia solani]|uniref:O-methylsterigmatocystin oxidoreductase n=1 Tax=Rhizoctonia solani TaxID=456999 RepID=A0A8H3H7N5_9AGAM|nr:unnamed protein product [Rhizoctonia solani]